MAGQIQEEEGKKWKERGWKKKGASLENWLEVRSILGFEVTSSFESTIAPAEELFLFLSGLNKQTFFPLLFSFSPSFPFALFTNPFFHSIVAFGNVRTFREPLTQEHSIWGKNVSISKCFIRWRSVHERLIPETMDPTKCCILETVGSHSDT